MMMRSRNAILEVKKRFFVSLLSLVLELIEKLTWSSEIKCVSISAKDL